MPLLNINTKGVKPLYKEASVLCSHCSIINNNQHTESNYPKLDVWVVTTWYIYTMEHYSVSQTRTFCGLWQWRWTWTDRITLNEATQRQKRDQAASLVYVMEKSGTRGSRAKNRGGNKAACLLSVRVWGTRQRVGQSNRIESPGEWRAIGHHRARINNNVLDLGNCWEYFKWYPSKSRTCLWSMLTRSSELYQNVTRDRTYSGAEHICTVLSANLSMSPVGPCIHTTLFKQNLLPVLSCTSVTCQ